MLNFIRLLIIILTLLTNAFHSECNDSLGAHNFWGAQASVGGPIRQWGGPGPPGPPAGYGPARNLTKPNPCRTTFQTGVAAATPLSQPLYASTPRMQS